jgi:hypothetical protein
MIIASLVISYLLPLQVYIGELNHWRPQQDLFVVCSRNVARLAGLPTPKKPLYHVILPDEFKLRPINKGDSIPKPRQLFFNRYINQESVFKNKKNAY